LCCGERHVTNTVSSIARQGKPDNPFNEGEGIIDINSGPAEAIKGIVEGILGKAKEVIGTFIGRNDLINEGQAQQDKAQAERDVAKKEAAADKARGKAKLQEARQKAQQ
jgi:uncharacterized protein YjbJ (UPF0337 family)